MLYKLNESVLKEEYNERTLNEVVNCIKNIRILSLNIVNLLSKIRELCSYNVLGGKFDLDKINKIYLFDKNYLIKMKYDLDFLKDSKIADVYAIECEESDPFLVYVNFKNQENEKKYFIKVTDDMVGSIKQGQFVILQDLIFFHIYNINISKRNISVRSNSPRSSSFRRSAYSGNKYLNNNNNNNPILKKAIGKLIRLYSPPKNLQLKKTEFRPHSSGIQAPSNKNNIFKL